MDDKTQRWLNACFAGQLPPRDAISFDYEHVEFVRQLLDDHNWKQAGKDEIDPGGTYTGRSAKYNRPSIRALYVAPDGRMELSLTWGRIGFGLCGTMRCKLRG